MKLRYLLSLLLLFQLSAACKKGGLFDYRRPYTGNFKFSGTGHILWFPPPAVDSSFIIEYNGHIDMAENDKYIRIYFTEKEVVEVEINQEGKFEQLGFNHSVRGTFHGKEKITLEVSNGGHYGSTSYTITGKKRNFPNSR